MVMAPTPGSAWMATSGTWRHGVTPAPLNCAPQNLPGRLTPRLTSKAFAAASVVGLLTPRTVDWFCHEGWGQNFEIPPPPAP